MVRPIAPDDPTPDAPHADDPFDAFAEVFAEAESSGIEDPNAMILSTVDAEGQASSRAVLLKDWDRRGFVFYTNLESRKARELAANPRVALHFFWRELHRQVLILGTAEPVEDAEADTYFASRARTSQLGAWASRQSRPLRSRAHLLADVARVEARHLGRSVPRPPHWSGFRVKPHSFELWRAGLFRLHDRLLYELDEEGRWHRRRLYP